VGGAAVGGEFGEEEALADGASAAAGEFDAVGDGVLEGDEEAWGGALVAFVDQDAAAGEGVAVRSRVRSTVAGEERVPGREEGGWWARRWR
jgi:hypothetical protein